jgi:hypothetical protein
LESGQEEGNIFNSDQLEEFNLKPGEDWRKDVVGKLNGDRSFWDKEKCGSRDVCHIHHDWHELLPELVAL